MNHSDQAFCVACSCAIDSAGDYAIDDHGAALCTLCWLRAVSMCPDVSGGRVFWKGRRFIDGVPGDLSAWKINDEGEICPLPSSVMGSGQTNFWGRAVARNAHLSQTQRVK